MAHLTKGVSSTEVPGSRLSAKGRDRDGQSIPEWRRGAGWSPTLWLMTNDLVGPVPSIPVKWLNFSCMKCSTQVRMQVADNIRYRVLLSLPTESVLFSATANDEELAEVEDCLPCPLCSQERGGFYPLLRMVEEDEQALLDSFEAAVLDVLRTPEPQGPDSDDPHALTAFDAASNSWHSLPAQVEAVGAQLIALGYGRTAIDELAQVISERVQRRIEIEQRTAAAASLAGGCDAVPSQLSSLG